MSHNTFPRLTKHDLCNVFCDLGLDSEDSLVVHSALRTLGPVDGGADAVIDALLEVIGPSGNLAVPTFSRVYPPPAPYFDPSGTPSGTGILTEVLRKRPEAVRSRIDRHAVQCPEIRFPARIRFRIEHREVCGSRHKRVAAHIGHRHR